MGRQRKNAKFMAIQYYDDNEGWPVEWMCRSLCVSRAGYYKWRHHVKTAEEAENERIAELIEQYDEKYKHTLGYRRMTGYINRRNETNYGEKRIHKIMQKLNIRSIIRSKKKRSPSSTPEATAENIIRRDFNAGRPNEKWTTDVTEFKWYEGPKVHKIYLSAILDLYDRSVVSYIISRRNDSKLVFDTFEQAIAANPEATPIFHSDRGFQYTSKVFQTMLAKQGMTQSMSRVGHCIDNGPTEGFWGIIKSEMYYLRKFASEQELVQEINEFICFYNAGRFQERFGYRSPLEVRQEALSAESPTQYPIAPNLRIQKYKARYAG